MTTCKLANVS